MVFTIVDTIVPGILLRAPAPEFDRRSHPHEVIVDLKRSPEAEPT